MATHIRPPIRGAVVYLRRIEALDGAPHLGILRATPAARANAGVIRGLRLSCLR